jgi:hypothetical protein
LNIALQPFKGRCLGQNVAFSGGGSCSTSQKRIGLLLFILATSVERFASTAPNWYESTDAVYRLADSPVWLVSFTNINTNSFWLLGQRLSPIAMTLRRWTWRWRYRSLDFAFQARP